MTTAQPKRFNPRADVAYGKVYELPAAQVFAQHRWPGCVIAPTHRFADVDFAVMAPPQGIPNNRGGFKHQPGELIAFVEVKKRRKVAASWDSTIVHVNKHHCGRWAEKFLKVEVLCLVCFPDTVGWFDLATPPDGEEFIERWDRPGVQVPHALYNYDKITWMPELLPEILAAVAAENELEVSEPAEPATE